MNTIVVGVDGSEGAKDAVAFAAREAAAHRARLRVVTAWETPYSAYTGGFVPPSDMREQIALDADEAARDAAELAAELEPSIYVEHEAVQGYPAQVLVDESRTAMLVVVGSRGHGGFASMLLGSVSHEIAQHAACPVAIVPKTAVEPHARRERAVAAART